LNDREKGGASGTTKRTGRKPGNGKVGEGGHEKKRGRQRGRGTERKGQRARTTLRNIRGSETLVTKNNRILRGYTGG